jgi:hypothetical protein
MTTWLSRRWIGMTLATGAIVVVPLLLSADQLHEPRWFIAEVKPSHELEQILLILKEEASVLAEAKRK